MLLAEPVQAARCCYDDSCHARVECPIYHARHCGQPPYRVAMTWRHGYEMRDELCAVAVAELEQAHELA